MCMGLPHVILSDNGREFNNSLDDLLSNLLGIKRRLTTPYHPQVAVNTVCTQIISDCVCFISLYRQMDWSRGLIRHCNECLRSLWPQRRPNGAPSSTHAFSHTIPLDMTPHVSLLLSSCSVAVPLYQLT